MIVFELIFKHQTIVSVPGTSSKMASTVCQKLSKFFGKKQKISCGSDHTILFKFNQHHHISCRAGEHKVSPCTTIISKCDNLLHLHCSFISFCSKLAIKTLPCYRCYLYYMLVKFEENRSKASVHFPFYENSMHTNRL